MTRRTSRRQFVKETTLAGFGVWVAVGTRTWAQQNKSPNEKFNIACVGVGGKGGSDTDHAGMYGNVIGLCDVDEDRVNEKLAQMPDAKAYTDWRKMFDEIGKDVDAVTVSTADHNHAPVAIRAIKEGKHVYVQKPMTHSVYEARLLREAAKEKKVATQMGNQGTAADGLRRGVEVIQAGAIGPVKEIHVWTNRPVWPQAPDIVARPESKPAPSNLNWDVWIGPAPYREFHDSLHPFAWRGWWDFGTGALGDMACHTANLPFMACKLGYPTSVMCEEVHHLNPETYPSGARIVWEFPARGDGMPPLKFHWYEGKREGQKILPPTELFHGEQIADSGSIMVGEKGIMYSPSDYGTEWKLLPGDTFKDYKEPPQSLPRNNKDDPGMKEEWLTAAKEGKPEIALSNFDYAGMLTETVLLGNVAIRLHGKKLEWDGPNMKVTNAEEAAQYIKREYRKGWEI